MVFTPSKWKVYFRELILELNNTVSINNNKRTWAVMIPIVPDDTTAAGNDLLMQQFGVRGITGKIRVYLNTDPSITGPLPDNMVASSRAFFGICINRATIVSAADKVQFLRTNLNSVEDEFYTCWKNTKDTIYSQTTSLHAESATARFCDFDISQGGKPLAMSNDGFTFSDGNNFYLVLILKSDSRGLPAFVDVAGTLRFSFKNA